MNIFTVFLYISLDFKIFKTNKTKNDFFFVLWVDFVVFNVLINDNDCIYNLDIFVIRYYI